MKVPEVCPLCESEGTVEFQSCNKTARGEGGRSAVYEHTVCYCTSCGEAFMPVWLMNENVRRAREALAEIEVSE